MKSAKDLVTNAKQNIENLTPAQFAEEMRSRGVLLVDVREPSELEQHGLIAGAVHAPRGMLEFHADPTSPYHNKEFEPSRRVLLYCASGGRSALAAESLQRMGYARVAHLDGGFNGWKEAGHAIELP